MYLYTKIGDPQCPSCGILKSLRVVDIRGNRLSLHDAEMVHNLNKTDYEYIECRICREEFNIDWSRIDNDGIRHIKPCNDFDQVGTFLKNFNTDYKYPKIAKKKV